MALTNRDRISRALDLLGPALDRFLTETVEADLAPDLEGGWVEILRRVKTRPGEQPKSYSRTDPYDSLRMLTDNVPYRFRRGWDPIGNRLSRAQVSWASELLEMRNEFAHGQPFDNDAAERALDTCQRMLLAIDAPRDAEKVAKLRDDVRRVAYERADASAARANPKINAGTDKLPPWREVLVPHPDVQNDQFNAAEFAADLYTVAMNSGGTKSEYTDPTEFFARTFLTEGLRDLIAGNVARLTGDSNASPVVNLQTNFGGGKTHSMLALWHLASGEKSIDFGDEVAALAQPLDELSTGVRRVALVGNQMMPAVENDLDGRPGIRTMWGELAWQLGGMEAYKIIEEADRSSTNPGAALRELFELYTPAVILIDEWVAYARQLVNSSGLPAGDFDTQFTFAQTLTEAARATSGIQVVISIPASSNDMDGDQVSDEEVGGEYGREALARLKSVVGRTADQWQPANAQESFEIVRRRIFSVPDAAAMSQISVIAKTLVDFYRQHHNDFPTEIRDPAYIDRIKQCYPIHPELFDRLYQDWSTLDRFQRTRGVLQMMNRIVGTLWRDQDTNALVMPGTVPLADSDVVSEVAKYLDDNFKPVIHSDVAGNQSVPYQIDMNHELFGKRAVAQRLARAIFMAATPGLHTAHKGAEKKRIFVGTALPGDVPGNFHSALDALSNQSTYLYTESSRYWYDTQANTTRAARDHAAELPAADVWAEVERRLESLRRTTADTAFAGYHICPQSSADVHDEPNTRLVVVPMEHTYSARGDKPAAGWASDVLAHRGNANRQYKNSLVFLAADANRARDLDAAIRDYLAWKWVSENADDLGLGGQQTRQAAERRNAADDVAQARLLETYTWGLYPEQATGDPTFHLAASGTSGSTTDLFARTAEKLKEQITEVRTSSLIWMDLTGPLQAAWETGHVSVGDLYDFYARYPYMSRLRDREVLLAGLYSVFDDPIAWRQHGFAFAEAWDDDEQRYVGIHLPNHEGTLHLSNDTLVVKPDIAEAQYLRDAEEFADPEPGPDKETSTEWDGEEGEVTPDPGPSPDPAPRKANRRYFGSVRLDPRLPAKSFGEIEREVLRHFVGGDNDVEIRLEIAVTAPSEGFDDRVQRIVKENSNTLDFDSSGFESE